MLLSRLDDLIIHGAEDVANFLVDGVNFWINSLFGQRPVGEVCFPTAYDPDRCDGNKLSPAEASTISKCENPAYGLENMCFFARVRHICSNEDLLEEYDSLFAGGYQSVDAVEAEFVKAFGESYEYLDPVRSNVLTLQLATSIALVLIAFVRCRHWSS